jgi:hypothetical protein
MNDGPDVASGALAAFGIVLFTPYVTPNESDPQALLRSVTAERIRPGFATWKFVCEYSTPPRREYRGAGERDSGGGTGRETPGEFNNPLLELPTVKFAMASREVLLTQIFDNISGAIKPCTASNGEVFDPPPKTLERNIELTISRNERLTANHPAIGMMFQDAVNADVFWGLPPGVWKVKSILAERQQRQVANGSQFAFLRVEYAFEGKPLKIANLSNLSLPPANTIVSSWDLQLLDYGSYYYGPPPGPLSPGSMAGIGALGGRQQNGNNPQEIHFSGRAGNPKNGLLNGMGGALPDRVPVVSVGTNTLTVPTNSYPFTSGLQVTISNVGGAPPAPLVATNVYYVVSPGGSPTGTTFKLSLTQGGAAITYTTAGTGTTYIGSPGVFLQVRSYPWLRYGLLNLPQRFSQVQ